MNPHPRAVAIARAHAWMEAMEGGKFRTLSQLARAVGVDEGYVRRQMMEVLDFKTLREYKYSLQHEFR